MNMNSALLKLVFVLLVNSPLEEKQANILISSIREFGGIYANSPVYVFMSDTVNASCKTIIASNITFIPLEISNTRPHYPFLNKVLACAKAEEILQGKTETLVWMDVDGLVLREPDEFILGKNKKIAIRPVNLRNNVGLPATGPTDPYWQKIYDYTGLKMKKVPVVETLVDTQSVRMYLNCAVFSIRPDREIFKEWKRIFLLLVDDQDYQSKSCITYNHKIFLHQAVLSAVISSRIKENQIQWFSQKAGYPLHHQCQLPHGQRATNLNQLESLIYENLWNVPNCIMSVIRVDEPLRTWLQENYEKLTGKGVYAL
jgi:hypothetical protein